MQCIKQLKQKTVATKPPFPAAEDVFSHLFSGKRGSVWGVFSTVYQEEGEE